MEKFIEAMDKGTEYGFICEHGHELSKKELCDILKEYIYATYELTGKNQHKEVNEAIKEELLSDEE